LQIIVVGKGNDETIRKMLQTIQGKFLPMATVIFIDMDKTGAMQMESAFGIYSNSPIIPAGHWLVGQNGHLADYAFGTKPTIYMCREMACEMPLSSVEELQKKLDTL
jgi:hypothetical protein